jgi:uncharacterized protein (TIGR02266 family)
LILTIYLNCKKFEFDIDRVKKPRNNNIKGEEKMTKTERRSTQRVSAKYEINYIHEGDYLISFSKDISVDGMFIQTDNFPDVGDTTKLTFSIGNLNKVSVNAKVVWVNDVESTKDAGMGVQFINPPTHLKDAILKIVNRVAVLERESAL